MAQPNLIFTKRLTAAATITLPARLMLKRVRVFAAAVPAALQILVNGAKCAFAAPSNGTRGYASYEVEWDPGGLVLDSTLFTLTGAGAVVELVFSDGEIADGGDSPIPIEKFRAEVATRTTTGTSTLTFAKGLAKPRKVHVFQSASAGRLTWPAIGVGTQDIEAVVGERANYTTMVMPVTGQGGSGITTLTLTQTLDGAATQMIVVFYDA